MNRFLKYGLMIAAVGVLSCPVTSYAQDGATGPSGERVEQFKQRFQERWNQAYEGASDEQKAKMDAKREQWQGMSQDERRAAFRERRQQNDRGKPGPGVRPFDNDPGFGRGAPGRGFREGGPVRGPSVAPRFRNR